MARIATFVFALVCVGFGWKFAGRGPMPMDITTTGELMYPQSSGSNDMQVLSLGMFTFTITAIYAIASAILNHRLKYLGFVYLSNLALFTFFLFLVLLDSSLLFAAKVGDRLPIIGVVFAYLPIPIVAMLCGYKNINSHNGSVPG